MAFADSSELSVSIRNAVRHLKHLGESFRTNTHTENDLNNIDYVADTLMALEKEILKLYGDYETESIASSQHRHRLKFLPSSIKNEIQAAVNMARQSNVSVIQKLQKELDTHLQQVREYTEQDTQLNAAITALQAEKNSSQEQYNTTITEVNQRISDKATLQIRLNETRDTVRETNQHTFELEEDLMSLKERLIQERNDARQEKVRLEEDITVISKDYDKQEKANQTLKKDVDVANLKVSESEMQLRTMYRERERFENENNQLRKKIDEQTDLFEKAKQEYEHLLEEKRLFIESCGISLLDYQTKKAALENRATAAHERTAEETEKLKTLKQKHDDIVKQIEETVDASKTLDTTVKEREKELDEIKQDTAVKLEQTAKLNLDNAETTNELAAMKEAHQMMIDSLNFQLDTYNKELQVIRNTRITKQKERETLLKTIEQTKLTSRNNDIKHNRFVTQTTTKVNDLSERKVILDRNLREDQLQMKQVGERLTNLKEEYRQMKIDFEQQIKLLEENTAKLLSAIGTNRNKISETTPEFEHLKQQHEQLTTAYDTAKETMIETKRKKQEVLDKIANTERDIREKNKSRDITLLAVKECQRETQGTMEKAHEDMFKLEEDIYEQGCRLEIIEKENEHFQQTIDYLQSQIDLFNRFSQQSNGDIKNLDNNNHELIEILETGWKDDRQIENQSAQKDLEYIENLTTLLKQIDKRKEKVGTVVHHLIEELQKLKYYLEGMSTSPSPDHSIRPKSTSQRSRRRSLSNERSQSAIGSSTSQTDALKSQQRTQSTMRVDTVAPTPIHMDDNVKQQVDSFVNDHFDLQTGEHKKLPKNPKLRQLISQRSSRTEFSSWKSNLTSAPSPVEDHHQRKTTNTPKVAFV